MTSAKPLSIDAVSNLKRTTESAVDEGKRTAGVLLDHSGELIDSVSEQGRSTAADLGNRVIEFTKKNPVIALLLAVGTGALLVGAAKASPFRR